MKKEFYGQFIEKTLYQKNTYSLLCLILTMVILLLSCFLFFKKERTVIIPAVVEKEFWVEEGKVSPTYLEQFSLFLGQQILGKNAQSAPIQRQIILRHVSFDSYNMFRQKLIEEEKNLKEQNISYVFFPLEVEVVPKKLKAVLKGDTVTYVGPNRTTTKQDIFELNFTYQGGRLLLKEIKSIGNGNA